MAKKKTTTITWNKIKKGGELPDFYKRIFIKSSHEYITIGCLSEGYYDHEGKATWIWVDLDRQSIDLPKYWAPIPTSNG
jgi:hypothetical protein